MRPLRKDGFEGKQPRAGKVCLCKGTINVSKEVRTHCSEGDLCRRLEGKVSNGEQQEYYLLCRKAPKSLNNTSIHLNLIG